MCQKCGCKVFKLVSDVPCCTRCGKLVLPEIPVVMPEIPKLALQKKADFMKNTDLINKIRLCRDGGMSWPGIAEALTPDTDPKTLQRHYSDAMRERPAVTAATRHVNPARMTGAEATDIIRKNFEDIKDMRDLKIAWHVIACAFKIHMSLHSVKAAFLRVERELMA